MQKNSNAAIFAIRPEYAKSILDGTKKYEYTAYSPIPQKNPGRNQKT